LNSDAKVIIEIEKTTV